MTEVHWRCFHCGETFTLEQERCARKHFGGDELETPVCLMRAPGETALVTVLRKAQEELHRYRAEDTDLMRAIWAMEADYATRIRGAEEGGYARGLADGRKGDA